MSRVPRIRFKGFEEDWEQRKLGEIGTTYSGLSGKTKDDFGHGQASFITYMNVYSNPVSRCDMVEPIEIDNRQNEVEIGDVFFTTSSETPEEVGMTSVLTEKRGTIYLNSFCFGFRPFEKIDKYYLAYMLRSKNTREKIILLAQGISRYNISKNKVMEISVEVPSFDEQILIGKKFQLIDHLITLHQRKLQKLKIIKKSMLENLFPQNGEKTPKIRFSGFTKDWEQRKLGEIAERIIRKNEKLESTLPLTISAQYGLIDQNEFFDKRIASKDVRGYYLIKKGEFAYNKSTSVDAPFGAIKRLDKYNNGVLSTLYILFKIIDDTSTGSDYLVTYYATDLWHRGIQSIAAEGARNHGLLNIAPNDFFETMLSIPLNISEQKKVGDFFISLDHLITLHQSKLEKLQKIKKSMLESMFI